MKTALLGLAACLSVAVPAAAQDHYQSSPPRRTVVEKDWGPWLGPYRAKLVPSLMQDFGERYLYAAANSALPPPRPGERRVVFLGDSITDLWDLSKSYSRFYEKCPVLKAEMPELRQGRLLLCDLTAQVIQRCLDLLGIRTVERM